MTAGKPFSRSLPRSRFALPKPSWPGSLGKEATTAGQMTETQKWEAFRKAKADAQGGSVVNAQRKFLTDPPAEYRSVPQDQLTDLGEPEQKKEKRRKKEAAVANTGKSWWNPFQ